LFYTGDISTPLVKNTTVAAMLVATFVAGSFIASSELRAYAANTIRSIDIVDGEVKTADLANNSVTAGKIKDGEIKSAEIATSAIGQREIGTDAVGGSELVGVTELVFTTCDVPEVRTPTFSFGFQCNTPGVDADDTVIGTLSGTSCLAIADLETPRNGAVDANLYNFCGFEVDIPADATIAIIAFDKSIDSKT
jgi:hypothetical protein